MNEEKLASLRDKEALGAKLQAVLDDPNYKETIGAWLNNEYQYVLARISQAEQPHDLLRCQGAFKVLAGLEAWGKQVLKDSKDAYKKRRDIEEKKVNSI